MTLQLRSVGLWLLFLLAVPTVACAQDRSTADWNRIQADAVSAFAKYDEEGTAPVVSRKQLRRERTRAFHLLYYDLAAHIRTHYPPSRRRTSRYAFVLFTLAHYAELSGDIWYAWEYYTDVCRIIEEELMPVRVAAPPYNDISTHTLCLMRKDRLRRAINKAGPRPVRASILFSEDEPTVEDFLETIEAEGSLFAEEALGYAFHEARLALLRARELNPERNGCDDVCHATGMLRSIAEQRALPFDVRVTDNVTAIGIGLSAPALDMRGQALAQVANAVHDMYGSEVGEGAPRGMIFYGDIAAAETEVLEAILQEDTLLREMSGRWPDKRFSLDDHPLIFGRRLLEGTSGEDKRWGDVTMLRYPGSGIYSVGNASTLIRAVSEATRGEATLPTLDCPRGSLSAIRFCILQNGMFARFLDSRVSRVTGGQSVFRSVVARSEIWEASSDYFIEILEEETGLREQELRDTFLEFLDRHSVRWCQDSAVLETEVNLLWELFASSSATEID